MTGRLNFFSAYFCWSVDLFEQSHPVLAYALKAPPFAEEAVATAYARARETGSEAYGGQ